jgi:hypothetical protein
MAIMASTTLTLSASDASPSHTNRDQACTAGAEPNLSDVEWKSIPEWPEYEVSEYGHVRRRLPGGSPIGRVGRVLRPNRWGRYSRVYLHGRSGRRHITIHRLVALTFTGEPPSKLHQVAHNDGNRENNHYSNLRWATAAENSADKLRHGTLLRGEDVGISKFTERTVRQIRALASKGVPQELIAEIFATSQSHVGRIIRHELWGHVR